WSGPLGERGVVLLQRLGGGRGLGLPADHRLQGGPGGVGEGRGRVVEIGQQGAVGGDRVEGFVDVLVHPGLGGELGGAVHGHAAVVGDELHRLVAGEEVDVGGGDVLVLGGGRDGEGDAGAAGGGDRAVGPGRRGHEAQVLAHHGLHVGGEPGAADEEHAGALGVQRPGVVVGEAVGGVAHRAGGAPFGELGEGGDVLLAGPVGAGVAHAEGDDLLGGHEVGLQRAEDVQGR